MQQAMTPHHWLVQVANAYYVYGHFNPVIAHARLGVRPAPGARTPRVRLLLCLLTATAFVVHFIPVAPPRLMPQLGFRDIALEYGQSVYGSFGEGIPGQLLAMPSLHVGWAILLAYVVVTTARSRWRWLAVAAPGADVGRRRGDGQPLVGRRDRLRRTAGPVHRRGASGGCPDFRVPVPALEPVPPRQEGAAPASNGGAMRSLRALLPAALSPVPSPCPPRRARRRPTSSTRRAGADRGRRAHPGRDLA